MIVHHHLSQVEILEQRWHRLETSAMDGEGFGWPIPEFYRRI
jgi:hypothetical protein